MFTILVDCPMSCGYRVCVLSGQAESLLQLFYALHFGMARGIWRSPPTCQCEGCCTHGFETCQHHHLMELLVFFFFSSQMIVWLQRLMVTCAANIAVTISTPRF